MTLLGFVEAGAKRVKVLETALEREHGFRASHVALFVLWISYLVRYLRRYRIKSL
jgi:hypothetical protein